MPEAASSLTDWTPEEIASGRRWVAIWRSAAAALEQFRLAELRAIDSRRAIAQLCGAIPVSRRRRPSSGLVEQQR